MKAKSVFFCTECGNETGKWFGRCPACGAWNTIVEAPSAPSGNAAAKSAAVKIAGTRRSVPKPVAQLDDEEEIRFSTGMAEMDRVLGGGAVRGSLVLVGGAPGIGKSTLLLQICGNIPDAKILYVTGEESQRQLKMRSQRLGVSSDDLFVLAETDINAVTQSVEDLKPDILIIDSVQTMYNNDIASAPGSIGQVKDCTMAVMQLAKTMNITAFVIGHVNKEGEIAGRRFWSTWWTACCILKATVRSITAFCVPQKTVSVPQTRSAYLKCAIRGSVKFRIRPRSCCPAVRSMRPVHAFPA